MKLLIDIDDEDYRFITKTSSIPFGIDLVENIKNGTTLPKERCWIPVSERLPKPFEVCLWTTKDGDVIINHWDGQTSKYKAWMPLPEPYKEVENDS